MKNKCACTNVTDGYFGCNLLRGNEEKGVMASIWNFRQEFGAKKSDVLVKL